MTRASSSLYTPSGGWDLIRACWRTFTEPPTQDPPFAGSTLASVPFFQDRLGDGGMTVRGTISLYRTPAGRTRVGIEMPHPIWGGLWAPVRRRSFSLDEVLEVRWEPGRWGGELVLTAMRRDGFSSLPGSPRDRFPIRIGRADRARAEAFAHAVAVTDLPS